MPLSIKLNVCALPGYIASHVRAALLEVFGHGVLPDGRPAFFHPDALVIGGNIYLSDLVAAAQAVPGVEGVEVETMERLGDGPAVKLQAE